MNVKTRILAIRLIEKSYDNPKLFEEIKVDTGLENVKLKKESDLINGGNSYESCGARS